MPSNEFNYHLVYRKDKRAWYVTWTENRRSKRISTGTADEDEAKRYLQEFKAGLSSPPTKDTITLYKVLDEYLEAKRDVSSIQRITDIVVILKKYFGDISIDYITRKSSRNYISHRRKLNVKDGTIRRELGVLKAALNWIVKESWMPYAPQVELPPAPPPKDRWLTTEEIKKLLNACSSHHIKLFIIIALNAGARKGAILSLKWKQVDLENRQIDFNEPGRVITNKKRAVVPINNILYAALQEARLLAQSDYVIEHNGQGVKDVRIAFTRTAKKAGLPGVTPHTLRHTSATLMAQARIPMREIAGVLGHDDSRTTEKVYAKHHPDYLRDAVKVFEGVL